ncbi:MAG TPA: hypothetical protein DHW82_05675 [Spirochaetia bacterium]|nr:MAG: hypothetical protein A2Y41_10775 [Spirochaetes bacterium GWB1_36_13]HCL56482.1 hypothetical protein [Spirochaetia bacterium]
MGKDFSKKLAYFMELAEDFTQNNPFLEEAKEISSNLSQLVQNIQENKFNLTENIYQAMEMAFKKYKQNIKRINEQNETIKKTMSKVKDFYKEEISKKIKESEKSELAKNSFQLLKQGFENFEKTIETLNQQSEIFLETAKEIKNIYTAKKEDPKKKTELNSEESKKTVKAKA